MNSGRTKRKLAAILSAAAVGYSRLMAKDEAATVKTLNSYRDAMCGFIRQHGGRVVDAVGDNLLADFPSVVDEVASAVDIQRELAGRPAIAVLAFDNRSGDPEQEYFVDGITEDLITRLSAFRLFPVIARNSSFVYKGKSVDMKQISRELGVHYVVEGSVRKAGSEGEDHRSAYRRDHRTPPLGRRV